MNIERIFRGSPYYYERIQGIKFGENRLDFLSINFPPLCNYNCSFCFAANSLNKPQIGPKREMISVDAMMVIIQEASQYGLRHIEISGEGETTLPMFRPYLQKILQTASTLGIHVTIFTNGSLLDRKLLQLLCEYDVSLILSIKYFDAKKYNQNVGRRMFDVIYKNIQFVEEVFSHTDIVDGCHIYNFGLFSGVFENNQQDNEQLRAYCDAHDIFFSLSSQIPQGRLEDTQVDYLHQDSVVDQYQHNSIILAKSSVGDIGFSVCGTFYYGIGINFYGDWLFDAHAGIPIGNISQMHMSQAWERQKKLMHTLFTDYHCQSYCPLRDPNYQSFLQDCLLPNGGPGTQP